LLHTFADRVDDAKALISFPLLVRLRGTKVEIIWFYLKQIVLNRFY